MSPVLSESQWLTWLHCPQCRGHLALATANERRPDGRLLTGTLRCESCGHEYKVSRGVPRLLGQVPGIEVARTVDKFGTVWRHASAKMESTPFLEPELFLDFIEPVTPDFFRDKIVLDLGCGMGRFCQMALDFGARFVVGVDLGDAIEVAARRVGDHPQALFIQADALALPFREVFDYAFSVGVLHHTENPALAFAGLVATVQPGGAVSLWVYGQENNDWILRWVNPIRIRLTSALPDWALTALSHAVGNALYAVLASIYLPLARFAGLNFLASRLFQFDYLVHLGKLGRKTVVQVVLDHLAPYHAYYLPRSEVAAWMERAKLREVAISSRTHNSWRAFGRKPESPKSS